MSIIFILILGLVLRLVGLNQSLWLDETVQAITSRGSFLNLFIELRGDFHPPLYHLLMWFWVHLFGSKEVILRLPSVFFGIATIWFVYQIARLIKKERIFPLMVALVMATAPFHIYYSQEGRMYAFVTFATTLSFYYFSRIIIGEKTNKIAYILSTALMIYADYYGLFGFLAQIIVTFCLLRKRSFKIASLFLFPLLLFLPCLPFLWIQLKTGSQATLSLPGWGTLVNLNLIKALPLTFVKFALGRITIFDKKIYALVAGSLFLIYGFLMMKIFWLKKDIKEKKLLWIIFFWLIIPLLLAWVVSIFIPNYQPFRLILTLPAFYLLLVYGLSSFSSVFIRWLFLIFILTINFISLFVYYQNPYFHREDWRETVRFIEHSKNAIALLPSETSHWPYEYYSEGKVSLLGVGQGFNTVKEKDFLNLKIKTQRIYYIYYLADLFDPQNMIPNWLESEKFVKIKEVSFNQIRIQEWMAKEAMKE
jgi:mannosyltransferase